MNMFLFLAVALVTVVMVRGAPDNSGTEFIIGYMQNPFGSTSALLYVTTTKTTTVYVHVTAPRYSEIGLNENFELIRGQVKEISIDNRIRGVETALETKGVLITASDEVTVYGLNVETASNDAFLAFPLDVLGKEYYVVTYPNGGPAFMIVGVEDLTSITIKYSAQTNVTYGDEVYGPGSTQRLLIHKYDTFQARSLTDLSGTYISGDKKFAVFSGNILTKVNPYDSTVGSVDAIIDQMLPLSTWGKEFAVVPTPERTVGDVVRFIGSKDWTNVVVQCSGSYNETFTINNYMVVEKVTSSDEVCHVLSSEPILVALFVISQLSKSEPAEPSLITIPPMEQYAADYTFYTPTLSDGSSYTNFFMFVVRESKRSGLKLDGSPFPVDTVCTTIPNTIYCGGFVSVTDGVHTVRHDSPISVFGGYMYGHGGLESYGAPLGLRLAPINSPCSPTMSKTGDGIDNDCDGNIDEEICTVSPPADDDGDGLVDEDCAKPVPIDGNWGEWGAWIDTLCYCIEGSTTGNQPRRRTCNNPPPRYDGEQCLGSDTEYQSCTPTGDAACPIDGGYSNWSAWSACTVTCGEGITQRTRTCTNPSPANGGRDCSLLGVDSNSQSCHSHVDCEVNIVRDGGWATWESWDACTVMCGTGITNRIRHCDNPTPINGRECAGEAMEFMQCNTHECTIADADEISEVKKRQKRLSQPWMDSDIVFCMQSNIDWSVLENTTPPPDASGMNPMEMYMPVFKQICSAREMVMTCIKTVASQSQKPVDQFLQKLIIPTNMDNIMSYLCSKLNVIETHSMCAIIALALQLQDETSCIHELGPQMQPMLDYLNSTDPTQGEFDVPYFCSHMDPLPNCLTSVVSACNSELVDVIKTLTTMTVDSCGETAEVRAAHAPELTSKTTFVLFTALALLMAFML